MLGCVSGGLVPRAQFGRTLPATGHIHVADIYATFCNLAGHTQCEDHPPGGVPPSESLDMWPLISGKTDASPRIETVLSFIVTNNTQNPMGTSGDAALLQGDMKYIVGRQSGSGWWWGPAYPNTTVKLRATNPGCPAGCLCNITEDPTEHVDLSATMPGLKAALAARLAALGATVYQSDMDAVVDEEGAVQKAARLDWWQPWL